MKNLVGICTYNVSIMVGINNGVYTMLKKDVPPLILIKCACHSLTLAVSYDASECLLRTGISYCTKSQLVFKILVFDNRSIVACMKPPTRWLSIQIAVERIANQWLELKLNFQVTRQNEKYYT